MEDFRFPSLRRGGRSAPWHKAHSKTPGTALTRSIKYIQKQKHVKLKAKQKGHGLQANQKLMDPGNSQAPLARILFVGKSKARR